MEKNHQPGFNEKYPAGFFERGSLVTGVAHLYFFCARNSGHKRRSSKMNIIMKCFKRKVLVHWKLFVQPVQERCKNPGAEEQSPRGAGYLLYIGNEILLSYIGIIISHYFWIPTRMSMEVSN